MDSYLHINRMSQTTLLVTRERWTSLRRIQMTSIIYTIINLLNYDTSIMFNIYLQFIFKTDLHLFVNEHGCG